MKKIIFFTTILIFITACKENSVDNIELNYSNTGDAALVVVVENSDHSNFTLEEIAFTSYKQETLSIFSDIFSVPIDSLRNKDFDQIFDQYGEPWQIAGISKEAKSYYKKIVTLTDQTANISNLVDSLAKLDNEGYTIDMVFSLHGSETTIAFQKESIPITNLTSELKNRNIKIRVLYQTNCFSANALDKWSLTGIEACNGTLGANYLTIFAPANFTKAWLSGKNYKESVDFAYNEEIRQLKSYNDKLPLLDYITSGNYLSGSTPILGGNNIFITKNDYRQLEIQ